MQREPGITEALERTVQAGQSLVVRRAELLVAEIREFFHDGGILVLASAVALTGWLYLMRGLTDGLSIHYPRFVVEVAVGGAQVALASWLFLRSRLR
jgi:hypothetical protein